MASQSSFLTTRFGGYWHRDIPHEDTDLTHIGPDTPCGEYLRRYWQPVCLPAFPIYDSYTRPGYRLIPGRK